VQIATSFQPLILLVEDEENDALLLRIAFQKAGLKCAIFTVANGLQAQAYLNGDPPYHDRARYPFPALVVLDIIMPIMNGFEVLQWIRQRPELEKLPIVMLTGSDRISDANTAYKLGATSFLVKPMDFNKAPEMSRSFERLMQKA
jgi:CheY-like chemotaxis protein